MIKNITCIECPKGCRLEIEVESGKVVSVKGNQCKKGQTYARTEIECPARILTSTVLTEGLELKMLPVRTDKAIAKEKLFEAMEAIKKIKLSKSVRTGEIISRNFIVDGIDLIATRNVQLLN